MLWSLCATATPCDGRPDTEYTRADIGSSGSLSLAFTAIVTGVPNAVPAASATALGGLLTTSVAVAVSLALFASAPVPPARTVATLLAAADAVTVAGTTADAELPATRGPRAQVTTCPAAEQPAGIVPGVTPAGRVSVVVAAGSMSPVVLVTVAV